MPSYEERYAYLERHVDALKTNRTGDERQTEDEVFDKRTLMSIYGFMKDGYIDTVRYPISTGKEGNVFYAESSDKKGLALKIFRTSNSTFKRMRPYIEGDPRFKGIGGNRWKMIYTWTKKEYGNLLRYMDVGLPVPEPINFDKNCLIMDFVGTDKGPAPKLKSCILKNPNALYKNIVDFIDIGWNDAHLVHGDLSEYNILLQDDDTPIVIDVGQAMTCDSFYAKDLLKRDIMNVNRFFKNKDVDVEDSSEMEKRIVGTDDDEDEDQ